MLVRIWEWTIYQREEDRSYLDVGSAQCGDALNLAARYTRRLQSQHGLEIALQLRYGRGHGGEDCGGWR